MILFLTYHKVVNAADDSDGDFYNVTADDLAAQIQATLAAGFTSLTFDDLKSARPVDGKKFLLTFDDGTVDHHDIVLPILTRLGQRAVFFVPTSKLNRPGYLTDAQTAQLATAGQLIGCHSHEHKRLDTLSPEEIRTQLQTACQELTRIIGQAPWIFAPPGGFITPQVQATAKSLGMEIIRTMKWGFNRKPDFSALETAPLNRHTTKSKFQKILQGKQPQLLYFGKQAAKAIIPLRAYERIRSWIFKLGRKH